jgi:hypothetical protein
VINIEGKNTGRQTVNVKMKTQSGAETVKRFKFSAMPTDL